MAPGTLFVVATPIGNLEDITLRALRILREADLVCAEDTRRTRNLLRHYNIEARLVSVHEHNERQRTGQILERLRQGQSVAFVTDAGTPGVSDPGAELVRAVRQAGLPVVPIPGPSAVIAAVSVAGLETDRFAFAGFPPIRSKDRKQWFEWIRSLDQIAVVAFEAPHRVAETLRELGLYLVNRPILTGRELTKIHEEWRLGLADELADYFRSPQGEFVFVVLPSQTEDSKGTSLTDAEVAAVFGQITEIERPTDRRRAIRAVAERLRLTPNQVYAALERTKKSAL